MSAITAEALTFRYGTRVAVSGVSLSVKAGSCLALLGPNGAGKSTLMRMMCGLSRPDSGRVTCTKTLGYAPQELLVWSDLTASEQLVFMARMYDVDEPKRRAASVLEEVGLAQQAGDVAGTLSGGMKRRLSLGLALVHDPEVLILDEPTVGLDPPNRSRIHAALSSRVESGLAMLLSTHDMAEAERLGTQVGVMDEGQLIEIGTADGLKSRAKPREATLEDAFLELTGHGFHQ